MTTLLLLIALATPQISREEFCRRLGKIEEGTTKPKVLAILGKPDDVWTVKDPRIYCWKGEVWCYGTNGHLTLPTLGTVRFEDGKVQYKAHNGSKPKAASLFTERESREHLRFMYRPPDMQPRDEGSLRLLRVANRLIPLGKTKAMALIEEAARVGTGGDFLSVGLLYAVPLVIFELPPGKTHFRPPGLGGPWPPQPKDLSKLPRFPVAIHKDIPYTLVKGYSMGGLPESVGMFLRQFKDCKMRTTLLRPPDNPFEAGRSALQEWKWYFEEANMWNNGPYNDASSHMLTLNTLLARTALRTHAANRKWVTLDASEERSIEQDYLAAGGHWDEKRQMYMRADGSFRPDVLLRRARHIWKAAKVGHLSAEIDAEIDGEGSISYSVEVKEPPGQLIFPLLLRVYSGEEVLHTTFLNDKSGSAAMMHKPVEAARNQQPYHASGGVSLMTGFSYSPQQPNLVFEFQYRGKRYRSPVFTF
jgi:hypothetical protein